MRLWKSNGKLLEEGTGKSLKIGGQKKVQMQHPVMVLPSRKNNIFGKWAFWYQTYFCALGYKIFYIYKWDKDIIKSYGNVFGGFVQNANPVM
jgi:hypothetical protein